MSNFAQLATPMQGPLRATSAVGPDPLFAAALYYAGGLDDAVQHVLVPFVREARTLDETASCWFFRYGRGGEHLKVRVGGAKESYEALRLLFASVADGAWPSMPTTERDADEQWVRSPIIGPEDEQSKEPQDRCLVWCDYQRSPWIFGVGPLLDSDNYVASITDCLTAGCQRLLKEFEGESQSTGGTDKRRLMLHLIANAMAATAWPHESIFPYLTYHRDAIIRFLLIPNEEPAARAEALLKRFAAHAAKITGNERDSAGGHEAYLPQVLDALEPNTTAGAWSRAIGNLIRELRALPFESRQDPFARDFAFTPLFKVLHTVANALGIGLLNESFLYHLLLTGSGVAENAVALEPTWDWATA